MPLVPRSVVSRGQQGGSRRVASQQGFDPPPTCFAVSLLSSCPVLRYQNPGHLHCDSIVRSLHCDGGSSPLCFSISHSRGERSTICAGLSIPTLMSSARRMHRYRHPETTEQLFPDVRCACLDRQPLLGDDHCLRRRVQHANRHFRMESRFPPSSSFAVFPSLPMSPPVRQVRSEFHLPAQHPCVGRNSSPNAMLQRSLQCSGLAGHQSHRTFDDPTGQAFSHWGSLRTSRYRIRFLCPPCLRHPSHRSTQCHSRYFSHSTHCPT